MNTGCPRFIADTFHSTAPDTPWHPLTPHLTDCPRPPVSLRLVRESACGLARRVCWARPVHWTSFRRTEPRKRDAVAGHGLPGRHLNAVVP